MNAETKNNHYCLTNTPPVSLSQSFSSLSLSSPTQQSRKSIKNDNNACKNKKRRVRFASCVNVQTTLHLSDYTTDEIEKTWYSRMHVAVTKMEIQMMLKGAFFPMPLYSQQPLPQQQQDQQTPSALPQQRQQLPQSLPQQQPYNNNDLRPQQVMTCPRGLETYTTQGALSRRHNKAIACYVVLNEQYVQAKMGIYNPERLSLLYSQSISCHTAQMARAIGIQDEIAARHEELKEKVAANGIVCKKLVQQKKQQLLQQQQNTTRNGTSTKNASSGVSMINSRQNVEHLSPPSSCGVTDRRSNVSPPHSPKRGKL